MPIDSYRFLDFASRQIMRAWAEREARERREPGASTPAREGRRSHRSAGLPCSRNTDGAASRLEAAAGLALLLAACGSTGGGLPGPLAAPQDLTAVALSPTAIELRWHDVVEGEESFAIERALAGAGPFVEAALAAANATSHLDEGLLPETTYVYRVRARRAAEASDASNTATATTPAPPQVPPAPTGLLAEAVSESEIRLSWTDNAVDETGFRVERAADAGGPFVEIASAPADATGHADPGLAAKTPYWYRVRAENPAGFSAYSDTATAQTWCARGELLADQRLPVGSGFWLRAYDVWLPPGYDGSTPAPLVLAIHGGSGNKEAIALQTCPDRNLEHAGCLHRVAGCEGFIVVYANGTRYDRVLDIRTFNATNAGQVPWASDWVCVSDEACGNDVDDVAYFDALVTDLAATYSIDESRIFATGLSNGAAMSHRLACEWDRVAAIAPIAAGNQFDAVNGCSPARQVPVLQIHGTADPCWPLLASEEENPAFTCTGITGWRRTTERSMERWAEIDGCSTPPVETDRPDLDPADGTTVTEVTYPTCAGGAEVMILKVNGGGHTWPGGSDGLPEYLVGKVSRELHANEEMVRFFGAHPKH